MSQHYAKIAKSKRLQKLLAYLKRQGKYGATTLSLADELKSTAISTDCSELRRNGYDVKCSYIRTTGEGRRVHLYTLEPMRLDKRRETR
jgi:hypothetical protein